MNPEIRDMAPADIDAVFRIRQDPAVARNQYRIHPSENAEVWRARLLGLADTAIYRYKYSTISLDNTIVGYISQIHTESAGQKIVQCGWNLAPEFWGQGVMAAALSSLFDGLLSVDNVQHVFADCFRDNLRCKRLLSKLGFVPNAILIHHRIIIAAAMRCLHWIDRYRLDRNTWNQFRANQITKQTTGVAEQA